MENQSAGQQESQGHPFRLNKGSPWNVVSAVETRCEYQIHYRGLEQVQENPYFSWKDCLGPGCGEVWHLFCKDMGKCHQKRRWWRQKSWLHNRNGPCKMLKGKDRKKVMDLLGMFCGPAFCNIYVPSFVNCSFTFYVSSLTAPLINWADHPLQSYPYPITNIPFIQSIPLQVPCNLAHACFHFPVWTKDLWGWKVNSISLCTDVVWPAVCFHICYFYYTVEWRERLVWTLIWNKSTE